MQLLSRVSWADQELLVINAIPIATATRVSFAKKGVGERNGSARLRDTEYLKDKIIFFKFKPFTSISFIQYCQSSYCFYLHIALSSRRRPYSYLV